MSWEFTEDFTTTEPVSTGQPPSVSGPYHVKIGSTELKTNDNGNQRVRWTNRVLDGEFAGCDIYDGISVPSESHKDGGAFARSLWVNLLVNLGHPKKKVQKKLKIAPKYLEGKTGYIQFITKEDAGGDYADVKWISKAQYDQLSKPQAEPKGVTLESTPDFDDDDDDDDDDPLDALDI